MEVEEEEEETRTEEACQMPGWLPMAAKQVAEAICTKSKLVQLPAIECEGRADHSDQRVRGRGSVRRTGEQSRAESTWG